MKIYSNPNIPATTGKGPWVSHLSSRGIPIACQASRTIPRFHSQLDQSPDVTAQTRVLQGLHRRNSRIYPRFPLQLEKHHETSPLQRDKARFPCIVCQAIPCSTSSMKGALNSLMALQSPEEHCHKSRETLRSLQQQEELHVHEINSR